MSLQSQYTQPAEVAFRFPKRFKRLLVPVSFDETVLRTGDCLARLSWGGRTFHLLPEKYSVLKSLRSYESIDDLIVKSTSGQVSLTEKACAQSRMDGKNAAEDEETDELLVENDDFADYKRRNRPDVVSDKWAFRPAAEPFNAAEWATVPHTGMPTKPQLPPAPLVGADAYRVFQDIPILNKRTYAKKLTNLLKKKKEKERLCAERKTLFNSWRPLLRKEYDSEPHEKPIHDLVCAQCGGEWFNKHVVCRDCGKNMRAYEPHALSVDELIAQDPQSENVSGASNLTKHNLTKGRPRKSITADKFVLALMLNRRRRLDWLVNDGEWDAVKSTARVLIGGELAKDVASDTAESQRAIEGRCERLLAALRAYSGSAAELPEIEPAHIMLLHKYFPDNESLDSVVGRYLHRHVFVNDCWVRKTA